MRTPAFSFDEIMAPLGVERFLAEYEGRKPLHLKGRPDKFAEVMTWATLGDLLSQATIWSQSSLQLVLDKKPIPDGELLRQRRRPRRRPGDAPRPRQGAGLSAPRRDADRQRHRSSEPGHDRLCRMPWSRTLGGMVQGNLYLSSRRRQGFAAHFDTHDVYAVHVEGTKTWHVYEGRAADPIAHAMFRSYGQEHHDKAKGGLLMEVHMEPGDLLYLPRGQYHDAIADEGGAVHIAFGVTYVIGLDVVSTLYERMMYEPVFRTNLPRLDGPGDDRALRERLRVLADGIATALAEPKMLEQIKVMQRNHHYPRHAYDLPGLLGETADERYRVRAAGIRMVQQGGRFGLVREGSRAATEVPADVSAMVGWVLERQQFSRHELAAAFPERGSAQLDSLLRDLGAMRLTEPIV